MRSRKRRLSHEKARPDGEKHVADILRLVPDLVLVVDVAAEGSPGEDPAQNIHQHGDRRPLGAAQRQHDAAQRRGGIGGRPALGVQRIAKRDRLAAPLRPPDLAPGRHGRRHVEEIGHLVARRHADGERVGAEEADTPARRAASPWRRWRRPSRYSRPPAPATHSSRPCRNDCCGGRRPGRGRIPPPWRWPPPWHGARRRSRGRCRRRARRRPASPCRASGPGPARPCRVPAVPHRPAGGRCHGCRRPGDRPPRGSRPPSPHGVPATRPGASPRRRIRWPHPAGRNTAAACHRFQASKFPLPSGSSE